MILNQYAEKAYMFDHMWRQIKEKFLFADLNKVDWDYYYNNYKKFYINNDYDFAEMVSEMLGELNASHRDAIMQNVEHQPEIKLQHLDFSMTILTKEMV